MIQASFKKREKNWVSFEISGHANYAEHGQDIVCAAVSALSITTVNNFERLAQFQPIVDIDEQNGGYLYVELPADLNDKQQAIAQLLMRQLYLGLHEDVMSMHSDFVQVKIVQ